MTNTVILEVPLAELSTIDVAAWAWRNGHTIARHTHEFATQGLEPIVRVPMPRLNAELAVLTRPGRARIAGTTQEATPCQTPS